MKVSYIEKTSVQHNTYFWHAFIEYKTKSIDELYVIFELKKIKDSKIRPN